MLSGLVVAILAPLLGGAFNIAISRSLRGRTKEIIVKKPLSGKVEKFDIDALASDEQVLRVVRNSLAFEDDVYEAIKRLQSTYRDLRAHHGRSVDFIAEYNDVRLAIECKSKLDRLTEDSLNKYLNAEGSLSKLLLLTRYPIKPSVIDFINNSENRERVSLVTIPEDSDLPDIVTSAIKKEFDIQSVTLEHLS